MATIAHDYISNICAQSLLLLSRQTSPHKPKKPPIKSGFFEERRVFAGDHQVKTYFSRASTLCCDWLAWANMAVAACETICDLARLVDSLA